MKKLFLFLGFIFVGVSSFSQLNYSDGTVMSKPVGVTIGAPTDMKSWFYTGSPSFQWRPYASTAEVLSNLNNATKRAGNVLYYVSVGGTVVPYWFRDGYTDGNLEPFFQDFYDSTAVLRTHFSNASNLTSGTISPSILPGKIVWDSLSYSDPAWITALSWSKILSAPSFALQQSLIDSIQVLRDSLELLQIALSETDTVFVGGGLAVDHTVINEKDSLYIENSSPTGTVTSVFEREGDVEAESSDYSAFYPLLSGSYNDPTWITGLGWSKVNKTGSSLAHLATRSAADLNSGTLPDDRLSTNVTQNSAPQNLSNKTLVNPKIDIDNLEAGTLLIVDGSNNIIALPPGSDGAFLKMVGSSPDWVLPEDPIISVSKSTVTRSTYENTPSATDSFTVSGTNLTTDVTVTLTTADGFEISEDNDSWQTTPITLTESGGTLVGQPVKIYVRIADDAPLGSLEGLITITSSGAANKTVTLDGEVTEEPVATITVDPSSLTSFTTEEGTPSSPQSFDVSGSDLEDDITVTAPSGYEVSLSSGSGYASSVEVEHVAGTVSPTPIYVRISASATVGSPSGNVACTSTNAETKNVAVSGTVTSSEAASDTIVAQFNPNQTAQSISDWVDVSGDPKATNVTATDNRNYMPVTLTSINSSQWQGLSGGVAAGNANGVNSTNWPTNLGQSYWYNNYPHQAWSSFALADTNIRISGLDPTKWYKIETYSAVGAVLGGCPEYYGRIYFVDSTTNRVTNREIPFRQNTSNIQTFTNMRPNADGIIWMAVYPNEGGTTANCGHVGIINAIRITKQGDYE